VPDRRRARGRGAPPERSVASLAEAAYPPVPGVAAV